MQQAFPPGVPPVLALDIGGTKLAVAVVDGDGTTRGWQLAPTRREEGPEVVIKRLFELGHAALQAAGSGPVAAVGISCGGPLDAAAGVLESPPHLPGCVPVLPQRHASSPSLKWHTPAAPERLTADAADAVGRGGLREGPGD